MTEQKRKYLLLAMTLTAMLCGSGAMAAVAEATTPPPHSVPESMPAAESPLVEPPSSEPLGVLTFGAPTDGSSTASPDSVIECQLSGLAYELKGEKDKFVASLSCPVAMELMELEVCPQEYETSEGKWRTLMNYCKHREFAGVASAKVETERYCKIGHLYRAWVWAWAKDYEGAEASNSKVSNNTACEA